MNIIPPRLIQPSFELEFEEILEELGHAPKVAKHKDEIFTLWYISPFIKRVCVSQPKWLQGLLEKDSLHVDYKNTYYLEKLNTVITQAQDVEELQRRLRRLRAAEYARIAWRDLQAYATIQQALTELSLFAESSIHLTLEWCFEWLKSRPHLSKFEQSIPQNVVVFALGKLGGSELNFSSDVDLVFAYKDDTSFSQDQQAAVSNFYLKLVQLLIKVLAEQTQDGFVFRVDTRLRPFGNSGTLIPSFSAIDQYFQTHGRDWERYAWIKARCLAGNVKQGEQFLEEVTPFIYRRYLDYGAIQSMREMKALVDEQAHQKSALENLKIGHGGIREIEFISQMFQLIYGGRNANLRIRSTLGAIKCLSEYEFLSAENANKLVEAYKFLRKAENGLQIREDQQTHVLPTGNQEKEKYAYLMGFSTWKYFYDEYKLHVLNVNNLFQELLQEDGSNINESDENEFVLLWKKIQDHKYCIEILEHYFNHDVQNIYKLLHSFSESGIVKQLVPLAQQRLDRFIPIMMQQALKAENPFLVLKRFIGILNKISQRSTYISLLTESQDKLSKLFNLIEVSQWVAQYISTHPLLIDEVLHMEDSYEPPSLKEMHYQIEIAVQNAGDDLEQYMESLREFKHAQVIQIAAADIIEAFPIMRVSDHLSWLAETCIESAVKRAYIDLVNKHGEPECEINGETYNPEILIIEYGKLGGLELGYGSDLDLVFVHNNTGSSGETSGFNKISNEVFFTRLVQRTIHILSTVTSAGKVFEIDTRLRPYGASGPIVSTVTGYENYMKKDAWLWEHQALVRARPVTKSTKLHNDFINIREDILCQPRNRNEVRESIEEMREKITTQHGSTGNKKFDIKKDTGGIVDIEFIVQFYVLSYANMHNEICKYTDNVRILDACSEAKLIKKEAVEELKSIYLKYREYLHQMSLKLLPETVDVSVFAKEQLTVQKYWTSLLH